MLLMLYSDPEKRKIRFPHRDLVVLQQLINQNENSYTNCLRVCFVFLAKMSDIFCFSFFNLMICCFVSHDKIKGLGFGLLLGQKNPSLGKRNNLWEFDRVDEKSINCENENNYLQR